jgi:hypothetical protein
MQLPLKGKSYTFSRPLGCVLVGGAGIGTILPGDPIEIISYGDANLMFLANWYGKNVLVFVKDAGNAGIIGEG